MKKILNDIGKACPDCGFILHIGVEKEKGKINQIEYCKQCGYRVEILDTNKN